MIRTTMTRKKYIHRILRAAVSILSLMPLLTGCWDSHELDTMLIITGVALDESSSPDQVDITLQIGQTRPTSSGSAGSADANSQEESTILLKTTSDTVLNGIAKFNRDSSHTLLLHHNQVLLLGSSLAGKGIEKRLDLFMRAQQARMEVPILVADGRAEGVLSTKPEEDVISGLFLEHVLDEMSTVSPYYQVRMLDFVSKLLEETSAPMAPMLTVYQEGDQKKIKVSGMAVFKDDRMTGRLNNDETLGYVWSMGNVRDSIVEAHNGSGKAVFRMAKLDCIRDVSLREDGGVKVELSVRATLNVVELSGLEKMTAEELLSCLEQMAQDEIQQKITGSFEAARRLGADIYGFGTSVYRKYPKQWRAMKDRWDEIFPDIELNVNARVRIPGIGQVGRPLEMERATHEN